MSGPRIGSLFTGTGALDLAVMDVYGGDVVWHSQYEPPDKDGREDTNQYAAKILERHWPDVPNLGDITKVDWQAVLDQYGPVDILTGGFPCRDVSSSGQRAGIAEGTHSGLWLHMARAISVLRPRLVVIENVEGLLSAKAASDVEPCAHCVGDGPTEPALRALGAVLGDLASLGFHAEWARVAASEVGAPHGRKRVFVLAWPAAADPADLGHEWGGDARDGRAGSAHRHLAIADAARAGWEGSGLRGRPAVHGETAADAFGIVPGDDSELPTGRDALRRRLRDDAPRCGTAAADTGSFRRRAEVLELRPGQPDVDWGDYGPAIRRWEPIIGRPAPWPTDLRGRLSPVFTEWMMGLPDGWVTCTPDLTRPAMLKALGNGVVRLQAATALPMLHARAQAWAVAA